MKVAKEKTVLSKMKNKLAATSATVVLRKDFAELGDYRQISKGLRQLIEQKLLVRIGSGIYAKTYLSKYTNTPLIEGGVDNALRQALTKVGAKWEPTRAEKEYNTGASTQVPVSNVVRLKTRCRRKIAYRSTKLIYEGNINAK